MYSRIFTFCNMLKFGVFEDYGPMIPGSCHETTHTWRLFRRERRFLICTVLRVGFFLGGIFSTLLYIFDHGDRLERMWRNFLFEASGMLLPQQTP